MAKIMIGQTGQTGAAGASVSAVRRDMDARIAGQMKKHFIAFDVETTGLSLS